MLLRNIQDVTDVLHMLLDFEILHIYICVETKRKGKRENEVNERK